MNRTDRLLAIVLELQRHGQRRAEDLAATFEVNRRTIYRDMDALSESGVPIVSVTGQGYSLIEGYFLPPLSFSVDEATMLLLGADFMHQSFDTPYGRAAQSASAKIEGVLRESLREDVRSVRAALRFIAPGSASPAIQARLQLLRHAILECRQIRFRYHARFADAQKGREEWREADPYLLTNVAQVWYLSALDHTKNDVRRFRLDRMEDLAMRDSTFIRPPADTLKALTDDGGGPRMLAVTVLFDKQVARWVREAQSWFAVAEEETTDGLLVTLQIRHEDEVLSWLLSWGGKAKVLEPASLRRRLKREAAAILAQPD